MTPMIDVVFLLLIFFICAATGQVKESSLSTQMNSGSVEAAPPEETPAWQTEIWVGLNRTEKEAPTIVTLNDRPLENFELLGRQLLALAEVSRENPVILDIGDKIPLEDVIQALDLCRAGKFESINFAVENAKKK